MTIYPVAPNVPPIYLGDRMELKLLTTDELGEIPRPHWLVEDFIAEKSTTMIYGPWGLGKSFMTLDILLHASSATEWNGRGIDRPLKTLFIVAEGAAWWYRRVLAFEREHPGVLDRDMVLWIPQPVDMYHPHGANQELGALERIIDEHRPDVLVIDTWVRCSAAYGMNEDKATDTAQAYKNIDYLRDKYDVAPVIVHHPTKLGKARGSGNQEASVERVIKLQEVEGHSTMFEVVDEKGNHIEPFEPFRMTFKSVDLTDLHEDVTSAVIMYEGLAPKGGAGGTDNASVLMQNVSGVMTSKGMTFSEIKGITQVKPGSVSDALRTLVRRGELRNEEGRYYLP